MKGKRGSSGVIVLILLVVVLAQHAYAASQNDVDLCDGTGGIWCGSVNSGSCMIASDNTKSCLVSINQNVTLDVSGTMKYSETKLMQYEFNTFTVDPGVTLQFYLAPQVLYSKAVDGTCADSLNTGHHEAFDCSDSWQYEGIPNKADYYTSSTGGKGGAGGQEARWPLCDIRGGGGGAGAGGGIMGTRGGTGFISGNEYSGGGGSESSGGNCAGSYDASKSSGIGIGGTGGRAGGFVQIKAKTIKIDGTLSVDGEKGGDGKTGQSRSNDGQGGNGGGPGAGGGGAGKIILSYDSISGSGLVTANGGAGGVGGTGSTGHKCANGANGGGGGGGDGGIIGLSAQPGSTSAEFTNVACNNGTGGLPGNIGDMGGCSGHDKQKVNATKGGDGKKGICGVTELKPGDLYAIDFPKGKNCNDKTDNDKDGTIDMNDTDCINAPYWDASIWPEYMQPNIPAYYDASAQNINDFACGDDTNVCTAVKTVEKCKVRADLDVYTNVCKSDFVMNGWTIDWSKTTCSATNPWPSACYLSDINGFKMCMYNESTGCESLSQAQCSSKSLICSWQPAINCAALWPQFCEAASVYGCGIGSNPLTSDLGGVTRDNQYLCLDSWSYADKEVKTPGKDYAWFDANGKVRSIQDAFANYLIFQASATQFISNGGEWFQCNASPSSPSYIPNASNIIKEYGTFRGRLASNTYYCSETLESAVSKENTDFTILDCAYGAGSDDAACQQKCDDAGENCRGWCRPTQYMGGKFQDTCNSVCFMKPDAGNNYISLFTYLSDPASRDALCTLYPFESGCVTQIQPDNVGNANFMNQAFCKINPSLCIGGIIPATKSCEQLHSEAGYIYSGGNANKLCNKTSICVNGRLVQTNKSIDSSGLCCFGQEAYCQQVTESGCTENGGEIKPANCDQCTCNSGITVGTCCLYGRWIDQSRAQIGINESFICYKQGRNSLIQECCGEKGCFNSDNPLNLKASLSPNVYSMDGVPLFSVANFDDVVGGALTRQVRTFLGNYIPGDKLPLAGEFFDSYNFVLNWSTFDYLEFDILYNADINYTLLFEDSNGTQCNFSINDNIAVQKGAQRWQHVTIGLRGSPYFNSCISRGFSPDAVNNTKTAILIGGEAQISTGVHIALDNFFLRSDGTGVNSQNRFCSGNWGDWVENLDGPSATDDSGFFTASAADKSNLSKYGPYRDACEGVISFGWTGFACCGDDTKSGAYGEFWKDMQGVCWKGTTVYNDQTIADALGLSPLASGWSSETSLAKRSLLFYDGNLSACDVNKNNYTDYSLSFDGKTMSTTSMADEIDEFVQPYAIRGSWMCEQGEGWVKLDDVNRVRLLAANLKEVAVQSGKDYTLACGDYSKLVNTFGSDGKTPYLDIPLTEYVCILRLGSNVLDSRTKTIIGVDISRQTSFDSYNNDVLTNRFLVVNMSNDETTCGTLSTKTADPDRFFTRCATDANSNGFYIYYNAPLNMMILSDGYIYSTNVHNTGFTSLFRSMWESIKEFFKRLFTSSNAEVNLNDLEKDVLSNDFYISVQKDRTVMGVMEKNLGLYTLVRVDYLNLSTDVKILSDALKVNYPDASVAYNASGNTQTIYMNVSTVEYNADWRMITSIMRLAPEGSPASFG